MKNLRILALVLIAGLIVALVLPAAPARLLAQEDVSNDDVSNDDVSNDDASNDDVDDGVDLRPRTLNVSGTGQASGQPDVAVVRLGVETEAEEAAAALSQNNEQMQALIDALQTAGIAEEKIQTQVVQLQPRYEQPDPQGQGTPQLAGYRATNLVEVRVEDLSSLGELLDTAVQAGGNRIENIRFEFGDPADLQDQAREAAWNDARHKAEQLAELAGAELGEVMTITETSRTPRPAVEPALGVQAEAHVPIQPGTQTMEIDIQVTWILE